MSIDKKIYRTVMDDHFPDHMEIRFGDQTLIYRKRSWKIPDPETGELIEKGLRYGENPGQEAALYELVGGELALGGCQFIGSDLGMVSAISDEDMLQSGKHPGKINLTDVDTGLIVLMHLANRPAAAIIKHNNPCGVAYGESLCEAYIKANMADRVAAFGGALVLNRAVDKETADQISRHYLEVIAAPDYEEGALDALKRRPNLRILRIPRMDRLEQYRNQRVVEFKSLRDGGIIVQQSAVNRIWSKDDLKPARAFYKGKEYVIRREPTEQEYEDILFGWAVEQAVSSNSVLYVKGGVTVGIGTGEQDRVGVAEIAIFKAYTKYAESLCYQRFGIPYKILEREVRLGRRPANQKEEIDQKVRDENGGLKGAVMISDAFFPFRDAVDVAIKEGISAIAHPGGSERDHESIEACNEAEPPVAMVFTGQRAFRH